jgi:hypothetical protein
MDMTVAINAQIAAQVAIEAVVNDPDAYNLVTIEAVKANAIANNVSDFYLEMITNV